MNSGEVVIAETGSANVASVVAALERLGARARVSDEAAVVRAAGRVVVPGVGAFGPAMAWLRDRGLDVVIGERVRLGRPLLAICLGMQVLCESSDESAGVAGIGAAPGRIERFVGVPRVPQMGWNRVEPTAGAVLLRPGEMYFANSYRLGRVPEGWSGAMSSYGGLFASAIERGAVLACQFHPEISGVDGMGLIDRWLALGAAVEDEAC